MRQHRESIVDGLARATLQLELRERIHIALAQLVEPHVPQERDQVRVDDLRLVLEHPGLLSRQVVLEERLGVVPERWHLLLFGHRGRRRAHSLGVENPLDVCALGRLGSYFGVGRWRSGDASAVAVR